MSNEQMTDPVLYPDGYGDKHSAVGGSVVYVDEVGVPHDALVTSVWGAKLGENAINVVFVSGAEDQRDQYGRQIVRATSVAADGPQAAHGRFYRVR